MGSDGEPTVFGFFKRLLGGQQSKPSGVKGSSAPGASSSPIEALAAEMRAKVKQSDDAHKARIRAHVERVPPATSEAHRGAIATAQRACLAIRHVFPPRHPQRSMSFLGGLPLAPDEFDSPMIHNREGLLEPLTFMAQVDVAALPDGGSRELLPKDGYLYFFAPMSGVFDASARHFVVRYVPGAARKNWGPQWTGIPKPLEGVKQARHRFGWMNWMDQPEMSYPTAYPRTEIEFGWIQDVGEVEPGDPDAADGFPWEVAKQRQRTQLVAFHGAPATYDAVLSPSGKPVDQIWIPYEEFPTNRRAAEILIGFAKSYIREERSAIQSKLEALSSEDGEEAARLNGLLRGYNEFESSHANVFRHFSARGGDATTLAEEEKTEILIMLDAMRAGELPPPVVERRYLQRRLPQVLNEWISIAAIESVESAMREPGWDVDIPPAIVEAVRYRHSVLKDPGFERSGEHAQHQMFGRGRLVQTAAEERAHERILLMQLSPDEPLGWRMGDNGVLQYWIHPADLAAQRFENTVLTMESH